jgi:cyclic-di-GMP-binding biofilm dispersal mediator protein
MTRLDGASVLVAGATGGLGAPISRRLAAAGARLTLVARSADRLEALADELGGAATAALDLREPAAATAAVDAALGAHGRLDGLVFAAGVVAFGPAVETDDRTIGHLLELNVLAPVRLLRSAVPHLERAAGDRGAAFVVNLSAVVAEQPTAGMAAYSASKAALTAYDIAAARELRRRRVHVLDVRPPHTETGLAGRPISGEPPRLPTGLDPEDVARRVLAAVEADERDLPAAAF